MCSTMKQVRLINQHMFIVQRTQFWRGSAPYLFIKIKFVNCVCWCSCRQGHWKASNLRHPDWTVIRFELFSNFELLKGWYGWIFLTALFGSKFKYCYRRFIDRQQEMGQGLHSRGTWNIQIRALTNRLLGGYCSGSGSGHHNVDGMTFRVFELKRPSVVVVWMMSSCAQ